MVATRSTLLLVVCLTRKAPAPTLYFLSSLNIMCERTLAFRGVVSQSTQLPADYPKNINRYQAQRKAKSQVCGFLKLKKRTETETETASFCFVCGTCLLFLSSSREFVVRLPVESYVLDRIKLGHKRCCRWLSAATPTVLHCLH